MRSARIRRFSWILAAVLSIAGLAGAYAQPTPLAAPGGATAVVNELNLPSDKAAAALKLVDGFLGQMQQSGKDLLAFLSQKTPEQLLDPQVSSRIGQIQKGFSLKFERFHLDLADIAGEEPAAKVVSRFKAIVPRVLMGDGDADPPVHASAPHSAAPAGVAQAGPPGGAPAAPQRVPPVSRRRSRSAAVAPPRCPTSTCR